MVTVDTAAASSSSVERDARLVSADPQGVSPGEIALGVVIGRTSEAFDFFVYGIASVLVFPAVVFPFVNPLTGTLYSFAIFGLAFVARPIGSVIFMAVDRRHGRGVKLTIALFLLGGSTASISFLPSYGDIGSWSIVMLVICRIGPRPGARRRLGRPSLAFGLECTAGPPGLVRHGATTRRTFRLHRGQRPLRLLSPQPVTGGFSVVGVALTRSSSPSRSMSWRSLRGCGSWRPSISPN